MSRIGKKIIQIPAGVTVKTEGDFIIVKGPKGEIRKKFPIEIKMEKGEKEIVFSPVAETKKTAALWGLSGSLLRGMLEGVTSGFEKKLEFEGVGYRANVEGDTLVMQLGFSHPTRLKIPAGISLKVEKSVITVSGFDKELVGGIAAKIRHLKPVEPYKGKGIRYQGEVVRRKAGKKAVASA